MFNYFETHIFKTRAGQKHIGRGVAVIWLLASVYKGSKRLTVKVGIHLRPEPNLLCRTSLD
jgi:hypothetical protein